MQTIKARGFLNSGIVRLLLGMFIIGLTGLMWGCGKSTSETEILIGEYSSLTGTAATFGR